MNDDKETRLARLQAVVSACRNCTLNSGRRRTVFGEGSVNPHLMVLGEAPGRDEDKSGRPFIGRAGQLLRKLLAASGFDLRNVYIANVCKCRPPDNRPPEPEEIDECVKFLKKQIEIIAPGHILLLGRTAVRGLFPEHGKTPLDRLRADSKNNQLMFSGTRVFVTYHPSALLRDPSRKFGAMEDFTFLSTAMGTVFSDCDKETCPY